MSTVKEIHEQVREKRVKVDKADAMPEPVAVESKMVTGSSYIIQYGRREKLVKLQKTWEGP